MGKCWREVLWLNFRQFCVRSFKVYFRGIEEILKVYKQGYGIVLGKLICIFGVECFKIVIELININQ